MQDTLVRFDVEEVFQGLAPETRQVWIDPGSFTSCYEEYKLGKRYLVFGRKSGRMPSDTAAMSVAGHPVRKKPAPPGFDLAHPPTIYDAPECSGTRPADYPTIDRDIAMLRAARAGEPLPRVLGYVYLTPFRGWPLLNGPALAGAAVTIENDANKLTTIARPDGSFSLSDAPAGVYKVTAHLEPFVGYEGFPMLYIPEHGCGSADVPLRTTSVIRGTVLGSDGQPLGGIPVTATVADVPESDAPSLEETTASDGMFSIVGVPTSDVYLSAGPRIPSSDLPYRRVYYPGVSSRDSALRLRLKPGERRTEVTLRLGNRLRTSSVKVLVAFPAGVVVDGAVVRGTVNGDLKEVKRASARGKSVLVCVEGLSYEIDALFYPAPHPSPPMLTQRVGIVCGTSSEPVHLRTRTGRSEQ